MHFSSNDKYICVILRNKIIERKGSKRPGDIIPNQRKNEDEDEANIIPTNKMNITKPESSDNKGCWKIMI